MKQVSLLLLFSFAVMVSGCTAGSSDSQEGPQPSTERLDMDVESVVYPTQGVVCYKYNQGYGGGLSCLPLDETDLKAGSTRQ